MRRILAPHKEQDGWAYVRMPSGIAQPGKEPRYDVPRPLVCTALIAKDGEMFIEHHYNDAEPTSRVISSRRVEEAVETADFLKLCEEEGLTVTKFPLIRNADMRWRVDRYTDVSIAGYGTTLREAYYRYKAAAGEQS